jgi:hypothetical protein
LANPRRLARSTNVLLALLFVLLRPACDVFAASGESHHLVGVQQGHVHSAHQALGGHDDGRTCCSSIEMDALTVPAAAPLPPAPSGKLLALPGAGGLSFTAVAMPVRVLARRGPVPRLSYHARSLRRLD